MSKKKTKLPATTYETSKIGIGELIEKLTAAGEFAAAAQLAKRREDNAKRA